MKGILIVVLAGLLAGSAVHADDQQADDKAAESKPPCAFGFCMGQYMQRKWYRLGSWRNKKAEGRAGSMLYTIYDDRGFGGGLAVYWTDATGVCQLVGFSDIPSPANDDYGNAHKREFNNRTKLVTRKYGKPTIKEDFVKADFIWGDEPQYWLDGLKAGERVLANYWFADLPDGIESISVAVEPGYVTVKYQFANFDKCTEPFADEH